MRRLSVALLVAVCAFDTTAIGRATDIDNVAAFARLYGVVRYFYPSDAAAALDWNRMAVYGVARTRSAAGATQLAAALKEIFTPLGPGIVIGTALPPARAPKAPDPSLVAWRYFGAGMTLSTVPGPYRSRRTNRPPAAKGADDGIVARMFEAPALTPDAHTDVDLGAGLKARVARALPDAEATGKDRSTEPIATLRAALDSLREPDSNSIDTPSLDERLAGVVVAWNVFRHFYPYWNETGVDWNTTLLPQLERAAAATTRDAYRAALRQLVADARDGHGSVNDPRAASGRGTLPIRLARLDGQIVISASSVDAVPVGALVTEINGADASRRLADTVALNSGSPQWKEWRSLHEMVSCRQATDVTIAATVDASRVTQSLACGAAPPVEARPETISELAPGIWYVDLTRARMSQVSPVINTLASATGVVFDLRGYPTDAGAGILPYLLTAAESDRWMHVNKIVGPFGESAGWENFGWNIQPKQPHVGGRIVFMTDGRAISYAESVMGYVADRKLGIIVGSTTAGTNGNVAMAALPGGYSMGFTGMRVTRHDGTSPFHLIGVQPDVPVVPTIAGLKAGKDEVLARAVEVIRR
jgi:hypothetical protein